MAGCSKGDLNLDGVFSSLQSAASGVINDGLGGGRHTGTQGSHQPHLVLAILTVKDLHGQLPPGEACGFIKHHCYFSKLLRARVCLLHLLLTLGYGAEGELGNDMTGNTDM